MAIEVFKDVNGKKIADRDECEVYTLYGGEVEMVYHDPSHKYYVKDSSRDKGLREVMSVTTANGIINKPFLVTWAAGCGADRFKELVKPGAVLDEVDIEEIEKKIRWAHRDSLKTAASVGTLAHLFAEGVILNQLGRGPKPERPVNKQANKAIDAFLAFCQEGKIEFLDSEFKIYHREVGFAGTVDIEGIYNGELVLCDLKTSKDVYREHIMQVAAYMAAREFEYPDKKYEAAHIIRICKQTGKFKQKRVPRSVLLRAFDAYKCAYALTNSICDLDIILDAEDVIKQWRPRT